ncbi:unnamed protein product [Nippostrongylus brasiliensis]|uniref:Uncharacterized protein n=1 Tax=Nippostrongylus brasiliensis TaxID=27835 RepID=A0A0N4XKE0_NIPBR|nr:unnamed protein product [Nippostrongylus brasiliensis]
MEVMMWHCQAEERVIKIAAKCKGMHTSLTVPYGYKMNTILVEDKGQNEDQILEEVRGFPARTKNDSTNFTLQKASFKNKKLTRIIALVFFVLRKLGE